LGAFALEAEMSFLFPVFRVEKELGFAAFWELNTAVKP
jgi:hypothetical protein